MSVAHHEPGTDAARLRQRGLRVTGPRLAILAMLEEVGGHRSADELVLALRRAGYHHARTTVYNALDDLARAKLLRAAPVDAGALRYESAGESHHHFVCRGCGLIRNVDVCDDLAARPLPRLDGAELDELDVVYRGLCVRCVAEAAARPGEADDDHRAGAPGRPADNGRSASGDARAGHSDSRGPALISGPSSSTMVDAGVLQLHHN